MKIGILLYKIKGGIRKTISVILGLLLCNAAWGKPHFEKESKCLAMAMHFEAGTEGSFGRYLVANVILNRAIKNNQSICKVVYAPYQFSYNKKNAEQAFTTGKIPKNTVDIAQKIVLMFMLGIVLDVSRGSTAYHADYVNPYWNKKYRKTLKYKQHIFYKE